MDCSISTVPYRFLCLKFFVSIGRFVLVEFNCVSIVVVLLVLFWILPKSPCGPKDLESLPLNGETCANTYVKSNGIMAKKRMTVNEAGRNIDSFDLGFSLFIKWFKKQQEINFFLEECKYVLFLVHVFGFHVHIKIVARRSIISYYNSNREIQQFGIFPIGITHQLAWSFWNFSFF